MATLIKESHTSNGKTIHLNERESMFGTYENYFSVRFFDSTGTVQRNYNTYKEACEAVGKFLNATIVFADTIEFYKSYNIYSWFRENMGEDNFKSI